MLGGMDGGREEGGSSSIPSLSSRLCLLKGTAGEGEVLRSDTFRTL